MPDQTPEVEVPKEATLSEILDAVRELTSTVADCVEQIELMIKETKLTKRAGIFDQKGVTT